MGFFDFLFKKKQPVKQTIAVSVDMHPEAKSLLEIKRYLDGIISTDKYVSKKEYRQFLESKKGTADFFFTLVKSGLLAEFCDKNGLDIALVKDLLAKYESFEKIVDAHNEEYMRLALIEEKIYLDEILKNVISRDNADMTRAISPLRRADDAVELDNSYMSVEEQMAWFMERYEQVING